MGFPSLSRINSTASFASSSEVLVEAFEITTALDSEVLDEVIDSVSENSNVTKLLFFILLAERMSLLLYLTEN